MTAPTEGRTAEWPRHYNGAIMWGEPDEWQRPVACPLCGAAVLDTEAHVRWHGPEETDAPGR
jgi:hypothetical protein